MKIIRNPRSRQSAQALLSRVRASFTLFLCLIGGLRCLAQTATNSTAIDTNAVQAEMQTAIGQVEKIVNQTVPAYRRAPGMQVGHYPYWFHEGAIHPDFNHVDVRATQETPYAEFQYVTSDLNPGLVFLGSQLEFNSMMKYFYSNRSVPKKKLTEAEMAEVNRLYRIIGHCEHEMKVVQFAGSKTSADNGDNAEPADAAPQPATRSRLLNPYIGGGAILVLLLLVFVSRLAR